MIHAGGSSHTVHTDDDKRYGEQLTHIENHVGLPRLLHILGVLDEETEGEDECQHQSEIEARAYRCGM